MAERALDRALARRRNQPTPMATPAFLLPNATRVIVPMVFVATVGALAHATRALLRKRVKAPTERAGISWRKAILIPNAAMAPAADKAPAKDRRACCVRPMPNVLADSAWITFAAPNAAMGRVQLVLRPRKVKVPMVNANRLPLVGIRTANAILANAMDRALAMPNKCSSRRAINVLPRRNAHRGFAWIAFAAVRPAIRRVLRAPKPKKVPVPMVHADPLHTIPIPTKNVGADHATAIVSANTTMALHALRRAIVCRRIVSMACAAVTFVLVHA